MVKIDTYLAHISSSELSSAHVKDVNLKSAKKLVARALVTISGFEFNFLWE